MLQARQGFAAIHPCIRLPSVGEVVIDGDRLKKPVRVVLASLDAAFSCNGYRGLAAASFWPLRSGHFILVSAIHASEMSKSLRNRTVANNGKLCTSHPTSKVSVRKKSVAFQTLLPRAVYICACLF